MSTAATIGTVSPIVAAVVLSDYVALRWLLKLSRRVRDQGERIAHLEGRQNGADE